MTTKPPVNQRARVRILQTVLGGRPLRVEGDGKTALLTGIPGSIFHTLHLMLVGIRRSQLTRMAAALSYRTIFGLVPVLVVVAVALAALTKEETQQNVIKQLLTYGGLSDIRIEAEGPPPEGAVTSPQESRAQEATLDEWVNGLAVRAAKHIKSLPFNIIGAIALLTLIYAAFSMLVEIEQAFNQIYNAPEGRSWYQRLLQYWTLLTFGPILLIASFAITSFAQNSAESLASYGGTPHDAFKSVLGFVGAVVVSTVFLWLIYMIVPNTRVQVMPALLGAAVGGILWEAGKQAFTMYVGTSTSYKDLYGAVAVLPLFLMWIYLSWLVVLLGLQLAYSMQTYRQATARGLTSSVLATLGLLEDAHPANKPRIIDPSAILVALACVADRFQRGMTSDHAQVAQCTGIDEQAVGEMLEKLAGAGVLHRVVNMDRLGTYALSRPPSAIRAIEVLNMSDELAGANAKGRPDDPISRVLFQARERAVADKTLADLIEPVPVLTDDARAVPDPTPNTLPA